MASGSEPSMPGLERDKIQSDLRNLCENRGVERELAAQAGAEGARVVRTPSAEVPGPSSQPSPPQSLPDGVHSASQLRHLLLRLAETRPQHRPTADRLTDNQAKIARLLRALDPSNLPSPLLSGPPSDTK